MTTTDIAVAEDQYAPAIGTGATAGAALGVLDLYADAIDKAYGFAEKLCRTPLVGNVYRGKPADAAVAILYGAEIGLNPIQSLQQIFTVHGTPAIYARTMVALLKRRGYRFQTVESGDDKVTVTGTSPTGDTETSTWTIARADKAGYVPQIDPKTGEFKKNSNGKLIGNEKYLTDPQAMLYAKAAGEVCRKLAPDVLLGISRSHEDLESEPAPAPVRVTSERVAPDADATPVVGVPVQQWQPPAQEPDIEAETASEEGAKPDTAQVTPPAPDAEAADPPSEPMSTVAQQRKLAALLEQHGVQDKTAKLEYLAEQFKRTFTSAKELTREEASGLIEYLERPIEDDTSEQLPIAPEGGE